MRILAGDFNATLDHAELRRLIGRGYHDAAEQAGHRAADDVADRQVAAAATWWPSTTCSPTAASGSPRRAP